MFRVRILCIVLSAIAPLFAQDRAALSHTVRASAEATITAKPDRAQITVGVVTESATAKEAADQNANATAQLIQTLKQVLSGRGDVKTPSYSISPQYQYANDKPPKLTGYRAENSVLVTVDDLSLVGEVIDSSTNSGANTIGGIAFTLRNDEAVRNEAFAQAAIKAQATAEAIARALKLHVLGILQAETVGAGPVHPMISPQPVALMKATRAATPVETGTLEIHETVLVILQVQ